ncbi:MAG TPA: ATP-binding protein [Phenylobacterium sp.]|uniref:ATP-binding protein n=1 Tax=Phenylobacterium sp. TaxID=1871053 RepID=UPI002B498EAB|nr:ATP-binding protein [Phenylobacterium sp.]HKR88125.1 ATP-binding protein [Phenylobacterium sp.]
MTTCRWNAGLNALWRKLGFGPRRELAEARARAALAESRLEAVLEAIPEGLVLLDEEGRYILWNQAYAEIYHGSADLFEVGRRLVDVLRVGVERGDYPDARGREAEWLAERERQLLTTGARHEQRLADGRWLLVEDRRTAAGGTLGLRVDITDMKEQTLTLARAVAAAEAANRAKSEFLANVSHEIRTPLHGILGMTQVLAREQLGAEQQARVGLIRQSGQQLLELLNDLLDLAKIEAGKLTLQAADYRPAAIAQAACAPFESLAQDKGLRLELNLGDLEGVVWSGDSLRLQQVLSNLVSNAVKFTAQGRVSVSAELVGEGEAEFRVADTGIGIPPERLAEVFEKFAQVESASDRRFGGTGLGLALSRELAELMGGVLSAESAPGVGSVFRLRLPVTPAAIPELEAAEEAAPDATGPLCIRILAAEDNATNQVILRALLEPLGAQLTLVGDGRQAVEAFKVGRFDLMLMDIQMPVTDGVAATREIRALEARERRPRTPIIALSANVMAHQVAEYLAVGMDAVVGKPFEAEALWSAIARLASADDGAAGLEAAAG